MAANAEKQINSFIKGLVTESNPLTFPENASLDEENFILNRDGSRERRLGLDFEDDYVLNSLGTSFLENTTFHEWKLSGVGSEVSIGVVRAYDKLWFINMLARSPSAALLNSGDSITISGLASSAISTAVINNALIIVSHDLQYPYRLTYNSETDTVEASSYKVYVRDFWGVYDGLNDNQRPTALSEMHRYNLLNQGWAKSIQTTCIAPNTSNAIECTKVKLGVYPSNSDNWSLGKVADSASANFEKYDALEMKKRTHDFLHAPKGKHIIEVFDRGASRAIASQVPVAATPVISSSALSSWPTSITPVMVNVVDGATSSVVLTYNELPQDTETSSFSTIASFAGRVWYSGVRTAVIDADSYSPNLSGYVFFSQTVINDEKLGKCYQEADPTSDQISDIIDTDGGAVHIVDAINIIALVPTKSALIVFAENGVWQISGGEANFSATEYSTAKISAVGCNSPKTIVAVNNEVFYWAKAGIFRIVSDSADGGLKSENLSLTSIQTLYNNIPEDNKQKARGVFEEKENTIRWLYNNDLTYQGENKFNKELVLDLTLGAFYPNTFSDTGVYVADFVKIPDYAESQAVDEVYVGTDAVLITDLTEVVISILERSQREAPYSYLAIDPATAKFTLAKFNNTSFLDWEAYDSVGVDFTSYLVTGYEIFGEILRHKQVPYIFFYFDRTEDGFDANLNLTNQSSCIVQAQWNWANSANSGKWGTAFQAYRLTRPYIPSGILDTFDYGDRVIVTKNKLRGRGRAISLKISSETGKDMKLLGWAMKVTGDVTP